MINPTLDLGDVRSLSSIALIFAFDTLHDTSVKAFSQGHPGHAAQLQQKTQEIEAELATRDLIPAYRHLKELDLRPQQNRTCVALEHLTFLDYRDPSVLSLGTLLYLHDVMAERQLEAIQNADDRQLRTFKAVLDEVLSELARRGLLEAFLNLQRRELEWLRRHGGPRGCQQLSN